MPEYRAYIIGRDGHIQRFEPIVCADDDTAIAAASGWSTGMTWRCGRPTKNKVSNSTARLKKYFCASGSGRRPVTTRNAEP